MINRLGIIIAVYIEYVITLDLDLVYRRTGINFPDARAGFQMFNQKLDCSCQYGLLAPPIWRRSFLECVLRRANACHEIRMCGTTILRSYPDRRSVFSECPRSWIFLMTSQKSQPAIQNGSRSGPSRRVLSPETLGDDACRQIRTPPQRAISKLWCPNRVRCSTRSARTRRLFSIRTLPNSTF